VNKLLCGAIAVAAIASASPCLAADLPVKAPAATVTAAPSWTGFYTGLGVGARSTVSDPNVTASTFGATDFLAQTCSNVFGGCFTSAPINDTAFRFSIYGGYNWQIAPQWVVGLEGDLGFANKTTTLGGFVYPSSPGFFGGFGADSFSVKTTWDASARARAGFLINPSVMLYATGGAAWLHVETTSTCNTFFNGVCQPGGQSPAVITDSTTKLGWTVGGGIEAMLWSNWIARAEYRYADFGTISNTDSRGPAPYAVSFDLPLKSHMATFGLAYKWGNTTPSGGLPAAPMVAESWSGIYAGLAVGTRSTETDASVTGGAQFGQPLIGLTCGPGIAFQGGCISGEPINDTAFRFSVYGGYNWQFAPQWVVGIEGDWGFANKTTTLYGMQYPLLGFTTGLAADAFSVKTTWDASARGRVGFLVTPAVMAYATGGAAWLHIESTSTCNTFVNGSCTSLFGDPSASITHSTTKLGWTVGGGIEVQLRRNWIARGEYRYSDYGTISNTDTRDIFPNIFPPQVVSYDLRVRTHTATFGLAYKFDWANPFGEKY
jgi:outer membrane immunogenic protein